MPIWLDANRLKELTAGFSQARIAVVGDFFLDKYLDVEPAWEEPSLETGKPAHQVAEIRVFPGAAGTVVSNLASLGAGEIQAVGLIGDDGEGFELRRGLEQLGCATAHLVIDPSRHTPTYLKPRNRSVPGLAGEHSRYDTKNREATPGKIEQSIIRAMEAVVMEVDAVVLLDQVEEENCGVMTEAVRSAASKLAADHSQVTFWADSRRFARRFRNVIVKPNQHELFDGRDAKDSADLFQAAQNLRKEAQAPVFLTRGSQGVLVVDENVTEIPGFQIEGPIDPTGAGDSMTAGCVLALCSGGTLLEAGQIGNLVASITVPQLATTGTAKVEQLIPQWEQWQQQIKEV